MTATQLDAFGHVPTMKRAGKWGALFSSRSVEHTTPDDVFEALAVEVGGFDVDAAATRKNARAPVYFTRAKNGLAQRWAGRVWVNPPYGRNLTGAWVAKAHQAVTREDASIVVALLPARTDVAWFHEYIVKHGHEVRFIAGRLHFNAAKSGAPFPSMVVFFRRRPEWFARAEVLA